VITRAVLDDWVREWGLRDDVVEKDYVLGWLLWGIGANKSLGGSWVFKGGTCLKKCYIETYRFSEDLDFTVLPDGPIEPDDVLPLIDEVLSGVNDASGIDFSVETPRLKLRPGGRTAEGRIYYRGPRGAPQPARIKLDLSADEVLARPPVLRTIAHAFPDDLPAPGRSPLLRLRGALRREDPSHGGALAPARSLRHRQPLSPRGLTARAGADPIHA
jgi:hypothetical protein